MLNETEIKRGKKYAILTVVAEYEWQERYLCLLDELGDTVLTLKAIKFAHPEFAKPYGKRLKIENAVFWFGYQRLRYSDAKTLFAMKVLRFVTLN